MKKNFEPTRALKAGRVERTKSHIKEYAKLYCEDMVNILYDIASDENNYARDRIAAAEAILNRGYGKPVDANKLDEGIGETINVEKLSSAQLMSMIADYKDVEIMPTLSLPEPTKEGMAVEVAEELIERIEHENKE